MVLSSMSPIEALGHRRRVGEEVGSGGGVASAANGWQAGEKVEQPAGEVLGVEVVSNGDGRGSGRSAACRRGVGSGGREQRRRQR
jgi:hypothetical protein